MGEQTTANTLTLDQWRERLKNVESLIEQVDSMFTGALENPTLELFGFPGQKFPYVGDMYDVTEEMIVASLRLQPVPAEFFRHVGCFEISGAALIAGRWIFPGIERNDIGQVAQGLARFKVCVRELRRESDRLTSPESELSR